MIYKTILSLLVAFMLLTGCSVQRIAIKQPKTINWAGVCTLVAGGIIIGTIKFKTN